MTSELDSVAGRLRDAKAVTVFTGAGVSAESGVPTFRSDANSLWREVDVRNFAYPDGYRRNQPEAWRWYATRAAEAREVVPNAGHFGIAEIEEIVKSRSFGADAPRHDNSVPLVTQNIDSLHQRAGSESVVELHGSLREVRCFDCSARSPWPEVEELPDPVCERCGGLLRPDVVMFEELLPWGAMEQATRAAEACDL